MTNVLCGFFWLSFFLSCDIAAGKPQASCNDGGEKKSHSQDTQRPPGQVTS